MATEKESLSRRRSLSLPLSPSLEQATLFGGGTGRRRSRWKRGDVGHVFPGSRLPTVAFLHAYIAMLA